MRYFRTADANLYESIRMQLDAAWGHPDGQTITCFEPAETAPRDAAGRVLLAVNDEFCEYEAVAAVLPELLASGAVQEIAAADYAPAVPPLP